MKSNLRPRHWILVLPVLLAIAAATVYFLKDTQHWKSRAPLTDAQWIKNLEDPFRIQIKQPDRVISTFGVKSGETVADIGAGTGVFAFRLSAAVGPNGRVYAVEIKDALLDFIRKKMVDTQVTNIIPIKSSKDNPNLPDACCDKLLMSSVYGSLKDPVQFMSAVRRTLKPGGLIAVINPDSDKFGDKYFISSHQVIDGMTRAGFLLRESHDFMPSRHFLIFQSPAGN